MKLQITIAFIFLFSFLSAQYCGSFTTTDRLVQDNLQFDILNGPEAFNNLKYKVGIGPDGDLDTREYASVIQSMSTWAGGIDPNGSFKMALGVGSLQDWSPGPLDEEGQTNPDVCLNWDRVFTVTKEEIMKSIEIYQNQGPCSEIPEAVLNWPGRSNPNLPFPTDNVSADFWDENWDGAYDPCDGDFPYILSDGSSVASGVEESYNYMPSKISYYVMNDNGKAHEVTNSTAIQMQISTHIYSFNTPQLEDVIFIKRKVDNKATDDIRNFSFGNSFDFDLGCPENDYLGTDVDRDMLYVYNETAESDCDSQIPALEGSQFGVSVLKGFALPFLIVNIDGQDTLIPPPIGSGQGDTLVFLGMESSIIPINCEDPSISIACDPENGLEYFNILSGLNKNGTLILDNNGNPTKKMFSGTANDPNGWSMCNEDVIPQTKALITTGPGLLQPGARNEVILAMFYARGNSTGCQGINPVQLKHDQIKDFVDGNFFHNVGPPPPRIEMSNHPDGILLSILDLPIDYSEPVFPSDYGSAERYNFEGVKIYQVTSENFDLTELDNINFSRLIYQGDIENGVDELFNWSLIPNPDSNQPPVWIPQRQVDGADEGIADEFLFDRDPFTGLPPLQGEEYYFVAVSYGYNNYKEFDWIGFPDETELGQQYTYLETSCGIKVINSQTVLSSNEMKIDQSYSFESFGKEWRINNVKSDLQICLLSSSGQMINSQKLNMGDLLSSIIMDGLPTGIYIIRVLDKNSLSVIAHKVHWIE